MACLKGPNVVIQDEPALAQVIIIMIGMDLCGLMGMIFMSVSQRALRQQNHYYLHELQYSSCNILCKLLK